MEYLRIEIESGPVLECSPEFIRPFTLQDLRSTPKDGPHSYPLECASSQFSRTVDGVITVEPGTLRTQAFFNQPIKVFALIDGGWLPPPFVLSKHFLVDRNVIQAFNAITREHPRPDHLSTQWWLDLLQSPEVVFNPVPHAMEGSFQRMPTFEEFVEEFRKASDEIHLSMPTVQIIAYEEPHYRAAFQLLTNIQRRSLHETRFLQDTVPFVVHQSSAKAAESIEKEILASARKHKLANGSLVVIAVLSCLHETPAMLGPSPGRLVLKPREHFGTKEAYNALADLKHLELLVAGKALLDGPEYALCTCDKGLAMFWCALNPNRGSVVEEGDGFRFDFSLDRGLFPGLNNDGLDRLSNRIRE